MKENFTKLFHLVIACAVVFVLTAAPAAAELVFQEWEPFEPVVTDDSGCAGEDGMAQSMVHTTVTTMPRGNLNTHINARGTWTGISTGNEAAWLDIINDVLAMLGENLVWTIQQRLRILTQGPGNDFFLRYRFHVTVVGGEVTAYIDSLTTECTVD
jgi:hypothetical protein